jgi:hypothetical protein
VIYTYVPFMNVLFESRPLAATSWILPIVVSIGIFLAVEALKAALRARGTASSSADTLRGGS